ncbi:unnamed protein product [Phaedon cochleariae]|uniref:Ankyrin repeat domain-containing protein 33B n=1 Tax=Phaedon cochleariae TaxID=80249 RepID=A0A9P0GRI9_PHACE|nr:unnamed protein product [Phaedon cochleariae]
MNCNWADENGGVVNYFQRPRRVRFTLPPSDGVSGPRSHRFAASGPKRPPNIAENAPRTPKAPRRGASRRSASVQIDTGVVVRGGRRNKEYAPQFLSRSTGVLVAGSPGVRRRVYPTGSYSKGTLSPTATALPPAAASLEGRLLLRAARDGDDVILKDLLRNAAVLGISEADLNAVDGSGRTAFSYIASNGTIDLLEQILKLPGLDPNKSDNEGNSPLHFAAQAGQIECLNCMLSRCRGVEIDARNNLGFTPLMKAALQGRNKCAKLLLFAGANPTLRDNGRGFRADQWARFCGRYVCADVIEKHARQRLLERSTSYGRWGGENEMGARVMMGKVVPVPAVPQQQSHSLKSKLRKVFRTSSGPNTDPFSSARLVTQLTSAALCASSPVLPSGRTCPPVVKSLIRPLTVPRLQITLVNNNGDHPNHNNNNITPTDAAICVKSSPVAQHKMADGVEVVKPVRTKKKK